MQCRVLRLSASGFIITLGFGSRVGARSIISIDLVPQIPQLSSPLMWPRPRPLHLSIVAKSSNLVVWLTVAAGTAHPLIEPRSPLRGAIFHTSAAVAHGSVVVLSLVVHVETATAKPAEFVQKYVSAPR